MRALKHLASRSSSWLTAVVFANSLLVVFLLTGRTETGQWRLLSSLATAVIAETAADEGAGDSPGPMVTLPHVGVMLNTPSADHYVEAAFTLEMATERDKELVRQRLPRIRETSIGVLSELAPEQLRGSEGMKTAKEMLLQRFRKVIPADRLKAIYVTSLVMD